MLHYQYTKYLWLENGQFVGSDKREGRGNNPGKESTENREQRQDKPTNFVLTADCGQHVTGLGGK